MYTSVDKSENDCLLDSVAGNTLSGKPNSQEPQIHKQNKKKKIKERSGL